VVKIERIIFIILATFEKSFANAKFENSISISFSISISKSISI
jgi:hypothetical protein